MKTLVFANQMVGGHHLFDGNRGGKSGFQQFDDGKHGLGVKKTEFPGQFSVMQ